MSRFKEGSNDSKDSDKKKSDNVKSLLGGEIILEKVPVSGRAEKLVMMKAELAELLAAHKEELTFDVEMKDNGRHEIVYGGVRFNLMFIISDPVK